MAPIIATNSVPSSYSALCFPGAAALAQLPSVVLPFVDIKSKVALDNVVGEVFSWVTSRKIMEMQCELLISSFQNPKAIALVKENIGHISDGSSSHCPGALKLGLKKDASRWKEVEIDGCIWSDHLVEYSAL